MVITSFFNTISWIFHFIQTTNVQADKAIKMLTMPEDVLNTFRFYSSLYVCMYICIIKAIDFQVNWIRYTR